MGKSGFCLYTKYKKKDKKPGWNLDRRIYKT